MIWDDLGVSVLLILGLCLLLFWFRCGSKFNPSTPMVVRQAVSELAMP